MKLVLALMFLLTSSFALAEEVSTDCPWSNQDGRTAGKNIKSDSTSKSKGKGSQVVRE